MEKQRKLIKHMLKPSFFGPSEPEAELIETHISWIFLSGGYAYKMKKPVNFGFLDFSSLAKRQFFCTEELRLNRRFAPDLYLAVTPVGGTSDEPLLGEEPALDYLVKMRRFPQESQLDRMLAANKLQPDILMAFAEKIASVHRQADKADHRSSFGTPESIIKPVRQNFEQIRSALPDSTSIQSINTIDDWSETTFSALQPVLLARREEGFIREGHGDMHLANMAWFTDKPLLFDCIEFNENLRWIDTINDIAFLVMDLDDRDRNQFAWVFLNAYLRHTGDYVGLRLLRFYQVYRAMVRAKVLCLRLRQPGVSTEERQADLESLESYLTLAEGYTQGQPPQLVITHGLSGSGKTTFINELAPHIDAICIHSDRERKRLHQPENSQFDSTAVHQGIYSDTASAKTYHRLTHLAGLILDAGFNVIVDATFITKVYRQQLQQLATDRQCALTILDFHLKEELLRQRIKQRAQQADSMSDADEKVLDFQIANADPLTEQERNISILVDEQTTAKTVGQTLRQNSNN